MSLGRDLAMRDIENVESNFHYIIQSTMNKQIIDVIGNYVFPNAPSSVKGNTGLTSGPTQTFLA